MLPSKLVDLQSQLDFVVSTLSGDDIIMSILRSNKAQEIDAWLGAGCINQRIWNALTKRESTYGIDDYDLVYFDRSDKSRKAQDVVQMYFSDAFPDIKIECTNQARVHLWYKEYFGNSISPLSSVEDAIDYWPTTASAIGVCLRGARLNVYAPRGLTDLFSMTLRPNKGRVTEAVYLNKVKKWKAKWNELTVIDWNLKNSLE